MRTWFLCSLLLGCIADPRAGVDGDEDLGSDAHDTGDTGAPDTGAPDAGARDTGARDTGPRDTGSQDARPDGPDVGVLGCQQVVTTYPTDGFERYEPVVAGDQVFGHRLDPQGIVRSVDVTNGAPVAGPTDLLVDAEDTARLLLRPDGAEGFRLIYREGRDVVLDASVTFPDALMPFDVSPRRLVLPGRAVWVQGDALKLWRAGRVDTVGHGTITTVSMSPTGVAWITQPRGRVHVRLDDTLERTIGVVGQGPPVLVATREHVWWLSDGRPQVWRMGDDAGRPVTELTGCEALDAEGDTALVTCRNDPGVAPEGMVVVRITADGEATVLDRAGVIMAPRAAYGALAWARYDDPSAWCATPAEGTLRWWPAGDLEPFDVAIIQSGCLCCGAYWPTLQLDLGPRRVAWSYAGMPPSAAEIGVARCQ